MQDASSLNILDCNLELIICGLKERPDDLIVDCDLADEVVKWDDKGVGYQCFLSADYNLIKSFVNLCQVLYSEHKILFRVGCYRYIVKSSPHQEWQWAAAYTNDTDYEYFTERYMCSCIDVMFYAATFAEAIEEYNKFVVDLCGLDESECAKEGDDYLVLTPVVTVNAIDELDFAMTDDIEQLLK